MGHSRAGCLTEDLHRYRLSDIVTMCVHRAREFFQEGQINQNMDGSKEFLYLVFQINDSAITAWSNTVQVG